jgi:hypothetical protein
MSAADLNDILALAHWQAVERLSVLMNRVQTVDLTAPEILALIVVLEGADRRVNPSAAPVLSLIPRH